MRSQWTHADDITVCVFGDGATEEGVYHESLNFAAVQRVPVLFVCENNGLAIHSKRSDRQSYGLTEHASVYGIEGHRLSFATDPTEVHRELAPIVAAMRRDRRPRFVEIPMFRAKEHVGPGEDFHRGYRSQHELTEWRLKDPLLAGGDNLAAAREAIAAEIEDAVAFAESSPMTPPHEVLTDVDRRFA